MEQDVNFKICVSLSAITNSKSMKHQHHCCLFLLHYFLNRNLRAPVITEFPGITVGGAITGGALESSSFRHQHFADALVSLQVVTANGQIVECSNTENADLFFGIRGSYGTLGRVTLW